MTDLLPLFLNLRGRRVLLVGGGPVATAKLRQLIAAGAAIQVVAPDISPEIVEMAVLDRHASGATIAIEPRCFIASDLDEVWLVVAAATPAANREVADEAEARHIFVNAVDDPANATAFLSGVVRRDGVTVAISTSGQAPALAALLREALDAVLPRDLSAWVWRARAERVAWRRDGVPMEERKPRLLEALNAIYSPPPLDADRDERRRGAPKRARPEGSLHYAESVPWLNGPEDSWL
jgi:uroporphyrin-III C-methyltransferase/precorrin-2 dehydrogenase/sirohydrochlorin ferrochelatase